MGTYFIMLKDSRALLSSIGEHMTLMKRDERKKVHPTR